MYITQRYDPWHDPTKFSDFTGACLALCYVYPPLSVVSG